jgi:hypothetical protein
MEKRFFTDNEHPAVVQEHEDVYISSDGREIVAKANRITEYAAKPRWKKIGHSILSTAIATGIYMSGAFVLYKYDIPPNPHNDEVEW